MKNNRLLITFLLGVVTLFCSCDNFLDETPNKSGSAYIYHMDQLYGMMGSPDLYLTIDASYSSFTALYVLANVVGRCCGIRP